MLIGEWFADHPATIYAREDSIVPHLDLSWLQESSEVVLVTHDYIVVETSALVQRGLGWEPLRRFIDDVVPALEVEYAGETLLSSALTALRGARSVTTSLVDQVSFEF
jgi:hypothetical protein